ncbi:MAG: 50S ribosomal protein L35 [Pseudomonadales bacterium]|jgi:large subunit ribosomal protein L35
MPKLKTSRGAAKRFRRTAKGFKHRKAFRNHILTKMKPKRKRQLRGLHDVSAADTPRIRRLLPKKAR